MSTSVGDPPLFPYLSMVHIIPNFSLYLFPINNDQYGYFSTDYFIWYNLLRFICKPVAMFMVNRK